ncbi:hypothetical protein CFC21_094680, partial [Triticum aestivum]
GRVAAAVGHWRAHRVQHPLPLRHQLHHADLRWPYRQPRALRRRHRPLRRLQLLLRLPPGHGERAGDAVRAGVRGGAGGHAGRVHAAVVDHPYGLGAPPLAALHLRRVHPAAAWPGGSHRGRRRRVHAAHHSADVRAGHQLPHAEVPAGAEQGDGAGMDRLRRPDRARRPAGPLRVPARLGRRRRRGGLRHLLLANRARAGGVRGRVVPGRVDGPLPRGVQRALGLRQALPRLRRDALPRDLVHDGARGAHGPPRRRRDRRGL